MWGVGKQLLGQSLCTQAIWFAAKLISYVNLRRGAFGERLPSWLQYKRSPGKGRRLGRGEEVEAKDRERGGRHPPSLCC